MTVGHGPCRRTATIRTTEGNGREGYYPEEDTGERVVLATLATAGYTSSATPEEVAKQDATISREFEARGFTNPIKVGKGGFLSSDDVWAVTAGLCRFEYRIGSNGAHWADVPDVATLLSVDRFKHCRS